MRAGYASEMGGRRGYFEALLGNADLVEGRKRKPLISASILEVAFNLDPRTPDLAPIAVGAGDYGMPATFIIGSGLVSTAGFTDVLGAAPWPDHGGATSA